MSARWKFPRPIQPIRSTLQTGKALWAAFAVLEGTLSDVTNLLQNAQELVVSAGNGTLNDSSRRAIATELRGNLDELLGLANRTDGNGQYLFSGFQGSTKPFADTGSGHSVFWRRRSADGTGQCIPPACCE